MLHIIRILPYHTNEYFDNNSIVGSSTVCTYYKNAHPIQRTHFVLCFQLYITQDFGNTWTLLQEYVKSFDWFSEDGSDQKYLIVQREELNGASIVLKLTSSSRIFLKPDLEVMLTSVNDLSVKGDFVFATKNSTENGTFAQVILNVCVSVNSQSTQRRNLFKNNNYGAGYGIANARIYWKHFLAFYRALFERLATAARTNTMNLEFARVHPINL